MRELVQDVKHKVRGQLELHRSGSEFHSLLERLPAAAYTCDSEGLITYFNQHAVKLWGRAPKLNDPADRFCGSFKLFSADGSPIHHDRCWMALALQEDREYNGYEIVIERPDGERISALAYANPIHGEIGELLGALNVLVDITDRKRVEEARLQLAAIVASSDDAIISKRLDGTIVSWNRGAEEIYGYAASEVIGRPISILLPPEGADELPVIMERLRRGERIEHYETKRRRKDGRIIDVSVTISPIKTDTGQIIGASAVARDITDRKHVEAERLRLLAQEQAARAEAQRANRLKDEVLAIVSHELRTPLTAILGWVRLLRAGKIDDHVEALEVIERNARAQAKIIEDLLDVSRIVGGKLSLDIRPVDISLLIETAISALRPSAEGIELQTQFDPKAGLVFGDADRLQQVITNLVSNAIKFTPAGGRVQVRVQHINSNVEITVSDSGQGIEANLLPHVFDRFRRGDRASAKSNRGLGLGLAIVRELVELHGGSVRAESPGKDQGATFTVSLPAMEAP